ncbi:MAG: hypothetical protein ABUS79_15360 [Pseudomonadota bacterium]
MSTFLAFFALLAAQAGCTLNGSDGDTGGADAGPTGSGGAIGAASGVPRSVRLIELTPTQASVLCDWTNLTQGGYARTATCPSGAAQSTNRSKQDCVNATSALGGRCVDVTVGNVEDCARAAGTDLCKVESAPACQAIVAC